MKEYYGWMFKNPCDQDPEEIDLEKVYSTPEAAKQAFEEWQPELGQEVVLVKVTLQPLSKLKLGGVVEVPL